MATFYLVLAGALQCQGPASPAGTAYLECTPEVGDVAFCPGSDSEEPECTVTDVVRLQDGRSIVRWVQL